MQFKSFRKIIFLKQILSAYNIYVSQSLFFVSSLPPSSVPFTPLPSLPPLPSPPLPPLPSPPSLLPLLTGILSFSLVGYATTIPTDGSGRILITDIGTDNDNALICRTNTPNPGHGNYYLHPSMVTISEGDWIESTDTRGWLRSRDVSNGLARLRRDGTSWTEGVFTCLFQGISDPPISVRVYHPSESISYM